MPSQKVFKEFRINEKKARYEHIRINKKSLSYPKRLLPRKTYKKIDINYFAKYGNWVLLRAISKDAIRFDGDNIFIRENQEAKFPFESNQLKDLSTNLLGIFRVEDCKIILKKPNSFFYQPYKFNTRVRRPCIYAVIKDESKYILCFKVKEILDENFLANINNKNKDLNLNLKIIHTPTNVNFWHCSIRVFSGDIPLLDLKDYKEKTNNNGKKKLPLKTSSILSSIKQVFVDVFATPIDLIDNKDIYSFIPCKVHIKYMSRRKRYLFK